MFQLGDNLSSRCKLLSSAQGAQQPMLLETLAGDDTPWFDLQTRY